MSATSSSNSLTARLAQSLPKDAKFTVYHVSTPPSDCDAIFSAPPGTKAEQTQCETQYLSLAVVVGSRQYIVFAIEILIYATDHLTTLFISKADSTGCLHLLSLPKGSPSPLRTVAVIFIEYLAQARQRPGTRLVVSLFARAQHSYLFPGSAENPNKHVLDDRGLIRWWCRNLDPVLRIALDEDISAITKEANVKDTCALSSRGFLVVPGCDLRETRSFFPKPAVDHLESRWTATHPLQQLDKSPSLPERCLIPRFPDDPKARYMDELDDELPEFQVLDQESPSNETNASRWRSVRSLGQFWEMMAFRQECSSGRLVGFIWAVFTPQDLLVDKHETGTTLTSSPPHGTAVTVLPTLAESQVQASTVAQQDLSLPVSPAHDVPITPPQADLPHLEDHAIYTHKVSPKCEADQKINLIADPLITNLPQAKETTDSSSRQTDKTVSSNWPSLGRGEVVLPEENYARTNKVLHELDFSSDQATEDSTKMWVDAVATVAGVKKWGQLVIGKKGVSEEIQNKTDPAPVLLTAGLVRKKKRATERDENVARAEVSGGDAPVDLFAEGLVRKKAKV